MDNLKYIPPLPAFPREQAGDLVDWLITASIVAADPRDRDRLHDLAVGLQKLADPESHWLR